MPLHKFNNPGLAYYKALSKYLELVREIPEVVEVRLSGDDELYAIISATPFDADPCYRVYWAEGKVMDSVNPQPYRFRSVNAQELPSEGRDEHITHLGSPVWAREAMSEPTEHKEGIVTTSKLNNTGLVYYQTMSKYLELVQEIPEVVEVRLSEDDTLCTIISATPHDDEPCYRVFAAQETVMRSLKQQPFLYDLVNCRELPEGAGERLSSLGDLVWQRDSRC